MTLSSERPGTRERKTLVELPEVTSRIAWVFPGQGSQSVGMGAGLRSAVARSTFEEASALLGWDVRAVTLHGPEERLAATDVAQAALYTVSVAAARTLREAGAAPDIVAGHSVGEFAALAAAGTLSFEDGLRVVAARGRAMARASRRRPGGMAAVLGLDPDAVAQSCEGAPGVAVISNFNAPGQCVVSGDDDSLEYVAAAARARGAARVVRLATSIAGHSPLMEDAVSAVADALTGVALRDPVTPFVSGVTAEISSASDIRDLLVRGVCAPVRWTSVVERLAGFGATTAIETGAGAVLSGLIRRIDNSIRTARAGDDDSIRDITGRGAVHASIR